MQFIFVLYAVNFTEMMKNFEIEIETFAPVVDENGDFKAMEIGWYHPYSKEIDFLTIEWSDFKRMADQYAGVQLDFYEYTEEDQLDRFDDESFSIELTPREIRDIVCGHLDELGQVILTLGAWTKEMRVVAKAFEISFREMKIERFLDGFCREFQNN